jgi:DNA transformation protein
MNDIKGDRMYVSLGASQVRRKLKGFGHGVRKIQSAGKSQSVIIHTATGRHLDELEELFADSALSDSEQGLGIPIENLPNLGPTSGKWLREVGIRTKDDLERFGPVAAFQLVRDRQPSVSLNLLWALSAALADKDWRELSKSEKRQLRSEVESD